jgi:hypothetical protein
MKLTNETVRTIKLMAGQGDLIVFDEKLSGFGFRVRRGSKGINQTWVIQYRDALRKSRRFIIGTLDELNAAKAREVAADMLANIRLGVYPHAEREKTRDLAEKERDKDTETFQTVGNLYLANRRKHLRERSFEEVRRHIEKKLVPFRSHLNSPNQSPYDRAADHGDCHQSRARYRHCAVNMSKRVMRP